MITIPQAYRTVHWHTCLLIGAMTPIATAMQSTGVDVMIGGGLVDAIGHMGPLVLLAGLFLVTAVLTQFMANTAAALVMLPPAVAAAAQLDVSAMPYILTAAVAAQAALLTPVGTPNHLMVMGPGGYGFGSYWKIRAAVADLVVRSHGRDRAALLEILRFPVPEVIRRTLTEISATKESRQRV